MTKIYLIRHAEAYGNEHRVFQGRLDGDLSENGVRQLELLAERFRNVPFDAIYSSPLRRAYKTAQAVDRARRLPIVTLDDLTEINVGHWEGHHFDELPALFPDENRLWNESPAKFCAVGGESMRHVYDRMWRAMETIVRAQPDRTAVAVSHGCAIRALLCRAKGWPLERVQEIGWCDNTSVSTLLFDGGMKAQVLKENDVSHLMNSPLTRQSGDWRRRSRPNLK